MDWDMSYFANNQEPFNLSEIYGILLLPDIGLDTNPDEIFGQWRRFSGLMFNSNPVKDMLQSYFKDFHKYISYRIIFTDIIEGTVNWSDVTFEDACIYMKKFADELQRQQNNTSTVAINEEFEHFQAEILQNSLCDEPLKLMSIFQSMLKREQDILKLAVNSQLSHMQLPNNNNNIRDDFVQNMRKAYAQLSQIENSTYDTSNKVDILENEFKALCQFFTDDDTSLQYNWPDQGCPPQAYQKEELTNRRICLEQNIQAAADYHQSFLCNEIHTLLNNFLLVLRNWQANQSLVTIGSHSRKSLELRELEKCCKRITKVLISCMQQVVKLQQMAVDQVKDQVQCSTQQYEALICEVARSAFVIEKHPPQVLLLHKIFKSRLRHLAASELKDIANVRFITTANLIDRHTVSAISEQINITPSGNMINNQAESSFSTTSDSILVEMENMRLVSSKHAVVEGERIADEKQCIVFHAEIFLKCPSMVQYNVQAKVLSSPVVVISHVKQEADANATIFWDNAFSEQQRTPFEVTRSVQLYDLLFHLDQLWIEELRKIGASKKKNINQSHDIRGLDDDAKRFLAMKLIGKSAGSLNPFSAVNWNMFQKDKIVPMEVKKNFSFWNYFYKIMKLVTCPLICNYWNAGIVMGFIDKATSERLLEQYTSGTFLLRFSQTVLGGLVITFRTENDEGGVKVVHYAPDTVKDFKQCSLADILKKLPHLRFLYPDLKKDDVFGQYYSEPSRSPHSMRYIPKPIFKEA
ncbi:signal transducer and activator of transcription 5B-like isoform X2 [Clavelina lepadiformis]|uniref:signal transducer and activator of transcription 5B-like isoform X2 n=1 Tax=Clavelina lepadiformis TaxID=159417 RepID=UPI0040436AD5